MYDKRGLCYFGKTLARKFSFYDIMYLPKYKIYARLHADKVDFDEKRYGEAYQ